MYFTSALIFVLIDSGVSSIPDPISRMENGRTLTGVYDHTSTAYFSPPKLILASSPVVPPMINYMSPRLHPAYVPALPVLPQHTTGYPHSEYDPAKPGEIIRTVQRGKHIPILRMASDFNFDGTFNYAYETGNGISVQRVGAQKDVDGRQGQVMHGTYSYISPEGVPISTTWYADETGFHATGSHLPTASPIPEVIANSLEYNRQVRPTILLTG